MLVQVIFYKYSFALNTFLILLLFKIFLGKIIIFVYTIKKMILSNILTIIVFYFIYYYLKGLRTCPCVNQLYAGNLEKVQEIFLGLNALMLILTSLLHFNILPMFKQFEKHLFKALILSGVVMLVFYTYIVYNTYYFYSTMGAHCECANKWEKYYLYYDAIIISFTLLSTLIISIFGVMNYKSASKRIR
jgi:hypothetical protein